MHKTPVRPLYLVFCILLCLLPGFLGAFATADSVLTWYPTLEKPFFNPPSWIFGPVWTTLYLLMGFALYLISQHPSKKARQARLFFIAHLAVNALWSFVFFGFHEIGVALGVISILWLMIVISIFMFYKLDRRAAYLLFPYLGWVSFAMLLNLTLLVLNP